MGGEGTGEGKEEFTNSVAMGISNSTRSLLVSLFLSLLRKESVNGGERERERDGSSRRWSHRRFRATSTMTECK